MTTIPIQPKPIFDNPQVRKVWHNDERFFCLPDMITAITKTANAKQYLKDLRGRNDKFAQEWKSLMVELEMPSRNGGRVANFVNITSILRIMESLPKIHREPFMKRYNDKKNLNTNYLTSPEHKSKVYPVTQTKPKIKKEKKLSALESIGLK